MTSKIVGWGSFAVLTALYVYMVVAAVGNLVLLPEMAAAIGLSVNGTGWFWLWLGIALPVIAYIIGLLVARRAKSGGSKLLVLATALAVTAAVQLEILHLVPQSTFFA